MDKKSIKDPQGPWFLVFITAVATTGWAIVTYLLQGQINWSSVIAFAGTFALIYQVLRKKMGNRQRN